MQATFGILNQLLRTIHGGICQIKQMVPHYSGTTLEAQKRYADGTKDCLVRFFDGHPIERDYLIVDQGKVVSPSYSYAFKTK
jgi:hypothetical protein